ncbi:hypothetical protein PENSTE_c026G03300 [Penicillium steckii]|uniref:Lipocalin-like domain-containing protein n=1 Tax=Penicillium steckii TaxID=303698 RepID=A0A1V6SQ64_9EURO|nr:hypothetical protein PENSTE_c026G03300 [Penicillium steckii]
MAAPYSKSIRDLNGIWPLNKSLSGDINELLRLQDVPWLLRRGIMMSRIALHTFQQVDSSGVTTITIHNMASGGIKGTTETRVVDGDSREHTDYIWGHVKGLCRFMPTGDTTTDDKLSGDWSEETREGECIVDETSAVDGSWSSVMIKVWGFEIIDNSRYLVRHVTVKRGNESSSAKLVYEYNGPTP